MCSRVYFAVCIRITLRLSRSWRPSLTRSICFDLILLPEDVSTAAAAEDDPEAFDEFLARSWVLLRSMFAAAGNSRRLALIKVS